MFKWFSTIFSLGAPDFYSTFGCVYKPTEKT